MSGVIAAMVASGGGAVPITMWYHPGATASFCYPCGYINQYVYEFGILSGSGPITWSVRYAASTAQCSSGWSQIGGGTLTGASITYQSLAAYGGYNEGFYKVVLSNAAGTYDSGWTKVSSECCYEDCCCKDYNGGPCNGAGWGCYNCSEVCNCPACEYDCSCDAVYGYGTGGCSCGPEEEACAWCWPSCPYGQTWCPTYCYCPCGDSCEYGFRECSVYSVGVWYSPPGTC